MHRMLKHTQNRKGTPLKTQLDEIRDLMLDGKWRSLQEIADSTNYPEPSISAQLRHLRKPQHGSYIVEKRYDKVSRIREYRLEI